MTDVYLIFWYLIRQFEFFRNTVKKKCIEKEIYAQNHKLLDTIFFKNLLEVTKMNQMHNRLWINIVLYTLDNGSFIADKALFIYDNVLYTLDDAWFISDEALFIPDDVFSVFLLKKPPCNIQNGLKKMI